MLRRLPLAGVLACLVLLSPSLHADESPAPLQIAKADESGKAGKAAKAGPRDRNPATPATLRKALARGVAYLVKAQRPNGSWGSPASNLHDIYAPAPGSQRAFQVGSAGLAISGLIESGDRSPAVRKAIARGADFLLSKYAVRRIRPDTLYNTWALAYALEAFARLIQYEKDSLRVLHYKRQKAYLAAAQDCVRLLVRFEFVEGGWGYYNFKERTARPGPGSTSFSTATGLVALVMAKQQGVKVPQRLIDRCVRVIRRCERPDNSYYYGPNYIYFRVLPVNKIKGSLARTPACVVALDYAKSPVPEAKFVKALEDLETYGHFLRIARKYTIPHETWYQNSGYFCLYGYFYAADCLSRVPPALAREHGALIGGHVARMQEKDGSFWDYQLFNFHKAYGTGYALVTLAHCLRAQGIKLGKTAVPPKPAAD